MGDETMQTLPTDGASVVPLNVHKAIRNSPHRYQRKGITSSAFTMAFQPIVDLDSQKIHGYEALVRGERGQGAAEVFAAANGDERYRLDAACRERAIQFAARRSLRSHLNVNVMINAVLDSNASIEGTLDFARRWGFPLRLLCLELTETEKPRDLARIAAQVRDQTSGKVQVAIDDFGAGYTCLRELIAIRPNVVKLDPCLTEGLQEDRYKRAVVEAILDAAKKLNIKTVAEGVETWDAAVALHDLGVRYFQGYYFGEPVANTFAATKFSGLY
jgi:EAL domain-containing protein (putative c-di-GMP-specific phosphodiesterase class I)